MSTATAVAAIAVVASATEPSLSPSPSSVAALMADLADLVLLESIRSALPRQADGSLIPLATLDAWTVRGIAGVVLPFRKIGGRKYVRPSDVANFLADSEAAAAARRAARNEAAVRARLAKARALVAGAREPEPVAAV